MGAAHCVAPMTKIALLLLSFSENGGTLKIEMTLRQVCILLCNKCILGAEPNSSSYY